MEHYVTLFDKLFLPQGIALHISMSRTIENFCLWILCVDDETYDVLKELNLENVRLLKLSLLENADLLAVKKNRTRAEYCWTLTPFTPDFVFGADISVDRVTYIDADLWFRKSPDLIFDEFEESSKQVLITDHGYAPEHDQTESSGKYCVQFITFSRAGSEVVRYWWQQRCLEWCFARIEDGKFGDQKYLDFWPILFPDNVHVLTDPGLTLAPWNVSRFPYSNSVFFHFHGLRIASNTELSLGSYVFPNVVIENVYERYARDIRSAIELLGSVGFKWSAQTKLSSYWFLGKLRNRVLRRLDVLLRNANRGRVIRF